MEQFEQFLADEAIRHDFYGRLRGLSRCLHISLSSEKVHEVFSDKKLDGFKRDWKQFTELGRSVQIRYQEVVDIKEYEPKVQKLLDDHVIAATCRDDHQGRQYQRSHGTSGRGRRERYYRRIEG